ncbi:MAG: IS110 family transposase, partial [Pseudobdellovibrionaceae bacterium]
YYEHPDLRLRELRNLLSLKRRLRRQEHGYRVRIRNQLVAKYFPELDVHYGESESVGLAIVRWCLSPGEIAGLKVEEFIGRVRGRRVGIKQRR